MFPTTLLSNYSLMSVLLCFVHPHSCMPQGHTGFNICLYRISLLCIDRADLLPTSQYILLYLSPSSSRFFLTCAFQRSLASSVRPGYFAVFERAEIVLNKNCFRPKRATSKRPERRGWLSNYCVVTSLVSDCYIHY